MDQYIIILEQGYRKCMQILITKLHSFLLVFYVI